MKYKMNHGIFYNIFICNLTSKITPSNASSAYSASSYFKKFYKLFFNFFSPWSKAGEAGGTVDIINHGHSSCNKLKLRATHFAAYHGQILLNESKIIYRRFSFSPSSIFIAVLFLRLFYRY